MKNTPFKNYKLKVLLESINTRIDQYKLEIRAEIYQLMLDNDTDKLSLDLKFDNKHIVQIELEEWQGAINLYVTELDEEHDACKHSLSYDSIDYHYAIYSELMKPKK
jgi:hypothetical protein